MDNLNNQQLTRRQRRLLKKQKEEEESLARRRRQQVKKLITISLPLILITGGLIWGLVSFWEGEDQARQLGPPKIEINPLEYDAGTVSMAKGLVKYTYEVKNIGEGDLEIQRIWTSCMCTSAILKVGGRTSPKFDMHTKSPLWSGKIIPGERGLLEVTFDPAFHGPRGTGSAIRVVYLATNDLQNQKAEARLVANVVP